jgi:hypothetical protein
MAKKHCYSESHTPSRIINVGLAMTLLSILLLSWSSANSQSYKVFKIDSTAHHYLVSIADGEGDSLKGIIVSEKALAIPKKPYSKIEIGHEYRFVLEKYLLFRFLNKTSFKTETNGEGGVAVDGVVVWKASDSTGLFETSSLQGLFYIIK